MNSIQYQTSIETKTGEIQVDFHCQLSSFHNGIGQYEFWGMEYNDFGQIEWEVVDVQWDHSSYTDEQNAEIQEAVNEDQFTQSLLDYFIQTEPHMDEEEFYLEDLTEPEI